MHHTEVRNGDGHQSPNIQISRYPDIQISGYPDVQISSMHKPEIRRPLQNIERVGCQPAKPAKPAKQGQAGLQASWHRFLSLRGFQAWSKGSSSLEDTACLLRPSQGATGRQAFYMCLAKPANIQLELDGGAHVLTLPPSQPARMPGFPPSLLGSKPRLQSQRPRCLDASNSRIQEVGGRGGQNHEEVRIKPRSRIVKRFAVRSDLQMLVNFVNCRNSQPQLK